MKRQAWFLFFVMAFSITAFAGDGRYLLLLTGPSLSKHFHPYHAEFNDFHLGLGFEGYYRKSHWLLGVNGHFMFNDSNDKNSWWIGIAPGHFIGEQKKLWGALALIAGGLKKAEYKGGRFSLFALPYLTVGYHRLGLNIAFIPRIARVTEPILLVQAKVLVYPFGRLR